MRNGRRDARPFVQCHAVLVLLASSANGHMIGAVDPFGSARPGARSSLSLVLLASAANGHIFDAAGPFGAAWPRASSTSREVKEPLAIDPVSYRSSSQGPRMVDEENEPALAEMDEVISRALRVGTTQPIIPQFPDAKSVLTIWKGTIIEQVWRSVALSMLAPTLLILGVRSLGIPDEAHPLIAILTAVHAGWNYQLTLSTFVVTFFVGQSYLFWKNAYALTRRVQGRMNDLGMLSAAHAVHGPDGKLSPDSEQLLTDLARNLRLVHLLFWADVLYRRTRAFGAPFRVLLSDAGLVRLTQRGLMTERELSVLREARLPPARWYMLVLQWYLTRLTMAMQAGLLVGGAGERGSLGSQGGWGRGSGGRWKGGGIMPAWPAYSALCATGHGRLALISAKSAGAPAQGARVTFLVAAH